MCVCVCLGESSRVRGHVRMHRRWWHKAEPWLDLTLLWKPLWRQASFVWPHTSSEEYMEKICGPVSLWDYTAPLFSALNNATDPMVPLSLQFKAFVLRRKMDLHVTVACHTRLTWPVQEQRWFLCMSVRMPLCCGVDGGKGGGLCVEIEMDQLKTTLARFL